MSVDNSKNTIVSTYDEMCEMMTFTEAICGCCVSDGYKKFQEENNQYFVKKGMFVVDDLMCIDYYDEKDKRRIKKVRYCFEFDFSDKQINKFTIWNYYNRERVADFIFDRETYDKDLKIMNAQITYKDMKSFKKLGYFSNQYLVKDVEKHWELFYKRHGSLPQNKFKPLYKKAIEKEDEMTLEFMCNHSLEMIDSTMYYYTEQKPKEITYESYFSKDKDLEINTKTEKYLYKYTGYINLNDSKIYRTKIDKNLKNHKSRTNTRHIESWSVRGHYRTIKGKKVWIDEHVRGTGQLENRIYGFKPESEMLLIPKVFECERQVAVNSDGKLVLKDNIVEKSKNQEPTNKIYESKENITQIIAPKSIFQKIKRFINKLLNKLKK